jgi:hypothetical protein
MTVRYKNTFRDVMAFCFYHYPRSPFIIGSYLLCVGIFSLAVLKALSEETNTTTKVIGFVVMECIVLVLFAATFAVSIVLSMISRRNKTFLTEHTIPLSEDGFTSETSYAKSEQKWTLVQKLARSRTYIFIYVAQYMAHAVPRRAFRDDAEWGTFYEFCRRKVGKR